MYGTHIPRKCSADLFIILSSSATFLTCGRANRAEFFVKNCQRFGPRAGSRARIIQAVTAVEGNQSGNKTGPWFRRIALRSFLAGVGLLGIAYAADYCVFRYRLATKRQPFGSVTVEHYYAVRAQRREGRAYFRSTGAADLRAQPFPTLRRSSVLVSHPAC